VSPVNRRSAPPAPSRQASCSDLTSSPPGAVYALGHDLAHGFRYRDASGTAVALALLCQQSTATIQGIPLMRRLTVKRVLLLLPLLLAPGLSPAADATSAQQVKFGIDVAQKGMWREALFRFRRAVEIDPRNPSALNDLAVALEQMGEFDDARKYYEEALKLKPDDLYIQQNYDLFREADDKRNRKKRRGGR